MSKYHQGKYIVKNPQKYMGDPTNVIFRSSWERKYMIWCDNTSSVIYWQSEETIVPYRCATDNKWHKYYLDFRIQVKNKEGNLKTYLVEIKPLSQTLPPKYPGKQTKRYLNESLTFMKNQSKWDAAKAFARDRGWEFVVLTEKHLGITNK
ncbi:head completion protein [uncultured Caudovirales phage]|uniref:Head completion nuclease n=1 Tax=uncultured Caudovirales phage TaxID=2100421 RepID=A0A6J5KX53_9CAUD|nr:head completion protein [uncultured Caudovirales phage]